MDFVRTYSSFEHGAREGMATDEKVRLLRIETPLAEDRLLALFEAPAWPLDLLDSLRMPAGSSWLFTDDSDEERPFTLRDRDAVVRACGLKSAPLGSFRLTWWIRKYAERSSHIGCADWLCDLADRNRGSGPLAKLLTRALSDTAFLADQAGNGLAVEQLTMVVNKDPTSGPLVLTPHIHADEYYGAMESAICSFFAEASSGHEARGTLFFPTLVAGDLGKSGRIDESEFVARFGLADVYASASGELLIYDGMQSLDGGIDLNRGLPHVSGDRNGRTCRLIILMRYENSRRSTVKAYA
ncbi:hypothetical protein D6851_04150 [Altericroceibacterium spongiae]|uniref:Phytanoyl-CoA dioxygenase n=1 Tax=Altericroceibacterium spongiae TaxID=2320269 RepID=A0A420EP26_9SPHN|nr:hypothetical protein [Altericroceibacterium spongiae]RKF22428.1 hypothetical protein D6851_04150 [Altericroceibacterium spongiae]